MSERCGCEESDSLTLTYWWEKWARQLHSAILQCQHQVPPPQQVSTSQEERQQAHLLGQIQQQEGKRGSGFPVWRIQSWFAFTVLTCSSREKTLDPAQYLVYQFFQTIQHYLKPQHIFLLISTAISKRLLCSLCHILTQLYVQAGCQPTFHTFTALTIHSHVLSPTCAATTPSFRLADMVRATKIALRGNRVQIAWETAQASKKQEKDSYQISNVLGIWVEAFGTGFAYSY